MATQVTATLPTNFGNSGFGDSPTGPTGSGKIAADKITELTSAAGVTIDKATTMSAGATVSGGTLTTAALSATTITNSGAITPTGGIKGVSGSVTASSFTVHSGGVATQAAATGTDKTAINTETYIVEVFVPVTTTFTGVSVMHLATSTGNVQFAMADRTGVVVAASTTASTGAVASAAFQQVPFSTPLTLTGPDSYFILMQNSGSNHFRAHAVGNFRANKKTAETYGTFTNVTPPPAFAADLGPICDLYV